MEALSGEFNEFYRRLKVVKDYHRRFPNEVVDPMDEEFLQLALDRQEGVASMLLPKRSCGRSAVQCSLTHAKTLWRSVFFSA